MADTIDSVANSLFSKPLDDYYASGGISRKDLNLKNIYTFPLELRDSSKNWPFMAFSTKISPESSVTNHIFFPIPSGLSFGDGMNYSTIDLGVISTTELGKEGGAALGGVTSMDASGLFSGGAIGSVVGAISGGATSLNAAATASLAARTANQEKLADRLDYSHKQVIAPNTNVKFDSTSIRSYQFNFKLVSRTAQETKVIKTVRELFQTYMYPEGDDLVFKYPPTWNIRFYDGFGNRNSYLPGIYDCYLTSFTTTVNASTNIFHEDGSPVEIDFQLGFQETKALSRKHIVNLTNYDTDTYIRPQ